MNTNSNLLVLDEPPIDGKRTDTIHASIIGVMVFSIVFHAIIGLIIYALVDIPEIKTPDKGDKVVHHVRLNTAPKTPPPIETPLPKKVSEEADNNPSKKPKDWAPYIKELDKSVKEVDKPNSTEKAIIEKNTEKENQLKPRAVKPKTSKPSAQTNTDKSTAKKAKPLVKNSTTKTQEEQKDGLIEYDATKEEKEKLHRAITQALDENFNRILTLWVKPREYKRRLTGVIDITLNDNGDIISTQISQPSGDFTLDLSVMEAIKRAKRFSQPTIGKLPRHFNFEYDSDMR